jgi:hypothetical protein
MDLLALPRNHSNTHANALGRTSTIDTLFSSDERHGDKLACILATYSWTWQLNTEEHRGYLYTRTCHGVHHHGGLRAMIRRTRTTTPGATCSFGRCGFHHATLDSAITIACHPWILTQKQPSCTPPRRTHKRTCHGHYVSWFISNNHPLNHDTPVRRIYRSVGSLSMSVPSLPSPCLSVPSLEHSLL